MGNTFVQYDKFYSNKNKFYELKNECLECGIFDIPVIILQRKKIIIK